MNSWVSIRKRLEHHEWYPWLIFVSVTSGTFMVNVDSSILNVALPVLQESFRVGPESLQWVVSAYLLVITGILPAVGKLSDIKGRKQIFIMGVSTFTLGSILSAMSASYLQLVIFRIVQAFGGAMIMGNVMSIVAHTFPLGKRGRPLGIIGSIVAAGTIAGPSLGGILIDQYGWRSIFWVNVPIGVLSILGATLLLSSESRSDSRTETFDRWGAVLFFVAITALLLYVSNGRQWGWGSFASWLSLLLSVAAWISFVLWEKHIHLPLIDLSFFRNPVFTIGNVAGFFSYLLMMLPAFLLPLFMHNVLEIPILHIGLLMTPQAVAMIVVSPVSGWLSDRIGHDWPSVIGMAVMSVGLWMMARFSVATEYMEILVALTVFGIGVGLFSSPNNVSVLESVPPEQSGITGGIIATVRNFGRVTGVAVAVLLLQFRLQGNQSAYSYTAGISFAFWVGSVLALMTLFLVLSRFRIGKKAVRSG